MVPVADVLLRMHLSMLSGGRGGGGGDFDKAFMPEGTALDFMDSPQGADI